MEGYNVLYVNIREFLDKNNKSVYWLANKTGIHNNNLTKMINNETSSIRFENIEKICDVFNCTPNDILKIIKTENNNE